MLPDILTPGTCLFIVILCLTTDAPLTVKHIFEDNLKWAPKCPNCGRNMTLVCYEKGPPIENEVFGCKLSDWNHPMLSLSYN